MNTSYSETDNPVVATTCGSGKRKTRVAYRFQEEFHSFCVDRKELLAAQTAACEKLLKYVSDSNEREALDKEIAELKLMMDLIQ